MKRLIIGEAGVPRLSWTFNRQRGIAGLGALTMDAENVLRDKMTPVYNAIDDISRLLNNLAATGYSDREAVLALQDTRAALREQLDNLLLELEGLEPEGTGLWNTTLEQISVDVGRLAATIRSLGQAGPTRRTVSVGVWVGVAIVGAVGAGFAIRYFGGRRRRG